jgi:exonuclease SbcC
MPGESLASILSAVVEQAAVQLDVATQGEQACLFELADTKRRQAEYASAGKALREAERRASVWLSLDALIGTRNGDAFRQFAQGLNLHRLIQKANVHLQRLSERYTLTQARNDDMPTLDFAIKDHWQGGEPRSTRTLSGGERFLVSLALALGLSDLRTQLLPIETLVLDEGFGTLDPDTLEVALAALQRLHADGRQVGVISHVNGLKERIEAQVQIVEEGAGRSRIVVVAPKLG